MLDAACIRLVGFDSARIPYIMRASGVTRLPFTEYGRGEYRVSIDGKDCLPDGIIPRVCLRPPSAWRDLLEAGEGARCRE
jgi:hypothetical protein